MALKKVLGLRKALKKVLGLRMALKKGSWVAHGQSFIQIINRRRKR
jgi:hypothetical protein